MKQKVMCQFNSGRPATNARSANCSGAIDQFDGPAPYCAAMFAKTRTSAPPIRATGITAPVQVNRPVLCLPLTTMAHIDLPAKPARRLRRQTAARSLESVRVINNQQVDATVLVFTARPGLLTAQFEGHNAQPSSQADTTPRFIFFDTPPMVSRCVSLFHCPATNPICCIRRK
jgi:hypothetical protein